MISISMQLGLRQGFDGSHDRILSIFTARDVKVATFPAISAAQRQNRWVEAKRFGANFGGKIGGQKGLNRPK
jgi:hypothetical protein